VSLLDRLRFRRDHRFTMAHAHEYLDGELDEHGRERIHEHTGLCPECRHMIATLRRTLRGLAGLRGPEDGDVALGVIARLRDEG
jgi:anti-sigma factor RsiW